MHQHTHTMKWELRTNEEKTVERYCTGCARKVEFKDSGVRRHNANGKNLTQFAIYKCKKGHTWNQRLQDYKAKVADIVSDPKSLERERYSILNSKPETVEITHSGLLKEILKNFESCTIKLYGQGKRVRLDKILSEKFDDMSRNQIQSAIEKGYVRINKSNTKSSAKLKAGDEIFISAEVLEMT